MADPQARYFLPHQKAAEMLLEKLASITAPHPPPSGRAAAASAAGALAASGRAASMAEIERLPNALDQRSLAAIQAARNADIAWHLIVAVRDESPLHFTSSTCFLRLGSRVPLLAAPFPPLHDRGGDVG